MKDVTRDRSRQAGPPRRSLTNVRWADRVLDELSSCARSFPNSHGEMAGLLFGTTATGFAVVEVATTVQLDNSVDSGLTMGERLGRGFDESISKSKLRPELASLEVIGWWCVRSVEDICQLKKEVKFHNQQFRRISDILLVLRPGPAETASATLYTRCVDLPLSPEHCVIANLHLSGARESNQPTPSTVSSTAITPHLYRKIDRTVNEVDGVRKTAKRRFAFSNSPAWLKKSRRPSKSGEHLQQRILRSTVSLLTEARNHVFSARAALSRFMVGPITAAKAHNSRWVVLLLFFLLASGVCLALVHFRFGAAQSNRSHLVSAASDSGLQMRADVRGEGILVSWNRAIQALRSAKSGVLLIQDGSQTRTVELEPSQLANGSLLYQPSTVDVNFRLTVYGSDGSNLTDNVRVLDGVAQPARVDALAASDAHSPTDAVAKTSSAGADRQVPKSGEQSVPAVQARTTPALVAHRSSGIAARPTEAPPPVSEEPHANEVKVDTPASIAKAHRSTASPESAAANTRAAQSPSVDGKAVETYMPPRPLKTVMLNAALFEPSLLAGVTQIEVEADIDAFGRVTTVRPLTSGENMSELVTAAAVSAAKQWVFEPARISGKTIAAKHKIVFRLSQP